MGHHDADAPPRPDPEDRRGEGVLALGVEVGVGLVQHHEERVAVEGAGEADALALACREAGARLAEAGVVTLRQTQDQVVRAGGLGGGDHRPRRRIGGEAGDVLGDRPGAKSSTSCGR